MTVTTARPASIPEADPDPPKPATPRRRASWSATWARRWAEADESNRTVLRLAGVGIAVFVLDAGAVGLTTTGSSAAAWFPAAGVSIGAVATSSGRLRRALLVVIGVASLLGFEAGGRPLSLSVCYTMASVIEAGLAGTFLGGQANRLTLATLRDLGRLLTVTVGTAVLTGALAGLAVWHFVGDAPWQTWSIVAVAHVTGALVLLPLVMRTPDHPGSLRSWERAAQSAVVLGITVAVFAPSRQLPLAFVPVVALVWTGQRLGARAASAQLLIVSGLTTVLTVHQRGPFAHSDRISAQQSHQVLQIFLLASTLMVLALTVASTQRKVALGRISANERFLDALIETMDVGVLAFDATGRPTMSNRTMREMHGTPEMDGGSSDPRARGTFTLFHTDGVTPLGPGEDALARVMAEGVVHDAQLTISVPDRAPRHVVVHGRQIQAEDGRRAGGVIAIHDVTVLKQRETELEVALSALAHQRQFEAAVMEVLNAGVVACDAAGRVVLRNAAQRRMTGVGEVSVQKSADLPTQLGMHLADGSEITVDQLPLYRALAGEDVIDLAVRITPADGTDHQVMVTAKAIHGTDGSLLGAVSAFTDVTAERVVQAQLRESVAFHDALLAASPDLIYIVEAHSGTSVWYSRNMTALLGYDEEEMQAMGEGSVARLIHPDDLVSLRSSQAAARDLPDGEVQQIRYRARAADGKYRWLSRRITPFTRAADGTVLQLLGVARDVTEAVDVEDRLTEAALHDPLTGLPNRRLLSDRLGLALRRTARSGGEVAVLFCDLDGFKHVNDTAGHAAGDNVLTVTADRLRAAVRPQDTVARVGGDEFVVVLDPMPVPPAAATKSSATPAAAAGPRPATLGAAASAEVVARRITQALAQPIDIDGAAYVVTVSIGVTLARSGDEPEAVLSDADSAMYKAKSHGKNRVEIFDTGLRDDAAERGRVERVLRRAIDRVAPGADAATGDDGKATRLALSVAYQPILDLGTQKLIGLEALARLHDAHGAPIEPGVFIPIAEETGLIAPLGRHILDTACADLGRWHAAHPAWRSLGVSVNLSARQAGRADLVPMIEDALDRTGISPGLLTLELTESVLLGAGRSALTALRAIRALGVKIDIDDFGTGYASLRYLAEFPVTGLKIDRSFTAGLPDDPTSRTIVRAIAGLARDLGLSCVAEGIETDAQLLALPPGLSGQGYLLGRPVPAAQIDARLAAEPVRPVAASARPKPAAASD